MNNVSSTESRPRRRVWPWVLGICLAPFVLAALAAASYLTLDSEAAALRRQVMSATHADWDTKVQFSVGRATLGAVRSALWFVRHEDVADARQALAAVRRASVGVYELSAGSPAVSRDALIVQTDRTMQARGWSRLVGVFEAKETVLIYVPDDLDPDEPIDVCLAVLEGRNLVVVSTRVDADEIGALVERHAGPEIKRSLAQHSPR